MYNLIKNRFLKKGIYDDISKVYDIIDVNDNCILIKKIML